MVRDSTVSETAWDVAIVGAGLVGASLAVAMGQLGLRTALLEAVPSRAPTQPSFDDRTLALSASSCRILQGLGVWPSLQKNATAIRQIMVTERDRPGRVVLEPNELGLDCFGHVVEARVYGAAIMQMASSMPTVEFLCPAVPGRIECSASTARVEFSLQGEPRALSARLLIGADGADSKVRDALGIAVERHDYGQTAIICNISPQNAHMGRAFECFTSTGPFAVLPHVNDRCGLVWSVATESAPGLLALPDQEFLSRAQALFGNVLGPWRRVGRRAHYPLRLVRALEDVRPRAIILGNAAHAIHPIGAQGFNLGLRDVAALAEAAADALRKDPKADVGAPELLHTYSMQRREDQARTVAYTDGLVRLFANPSRLAALARGLGMFAHALVPPLRRRLAISAMGYAGRSSRLAVGDTIL